MLNVILPRVLSCFSRVQFFVTPWSVARQAPLSMGFSRQEYWSELPFSALGDLPHPGIQPGSPVSQAVSCTAGGFFTNWTTREAAMENYSAIKRIKFDICSNINGLGGHYAKWNKSDKDKYSAIIICHHYMWNLKNITKQERSRFTDTENKTVVTSGEKEERAI